jgi:hypothetical protein
VSGGVEHLLVAVDDAELADGFVAGDEDGFVAAAVVLEVADEVGGPLFVAEGVADDDVEAVFAYVFAGASGSVGGVVVEFDHRGAVVGEGEGFVVGWARTSPV